MLDFKKPAPFRPVMKAVSYPGDTLPAAIILITDDNRAAIGQLLGGALTPQAIDNFVQTNTQAAFQTVGQPYGAYDAELPANPVAQLWQHAILPDPSDAVVVRRTGEVKFLVEASEGANFMVLYKGDAAQGKDPAALLCFTAAGKPTQFVPRGDASVFEGASFQSAAARAAEFGHVRDHVLRQCRSCTAHAASMAPR